MNGMPSVAPIVGDQIAARLRRFGQPAPVVAPLLASDAMRCARRISLRLFGVPYDVPFTAEEKARFEEGDYVDAVSAEVLAAVLGARTQIPFNWMPDYPLKGKADAGYRRRDESSDGGEKVVVEVKSANQRKFAKVIGAWSSVPAGPDTAWVVQAGLAALSPTINATGLHLVCVDNERYDVAEWAFDVDAPLDLPEWPNDHDPETGEVICPTARTLTMDELTRQTAILTLATEGTLAARDLPGVGRVADPSPDGGLWQCKFCPYQPTCARHDADTVEGFAEPVAA